MAVRDLISKLDNDSKYSKINKKLEDYIKLDKDEDALIGKYSPTDVLLELDGYTINDGQIELILGSSSSFSSDVRGNGIINITDPRSRIVVFNISVLDNKTDSFVFKQLTQIVNGDSYTKPKILNMKLYFEDHRGLQISSDKALFGGLQGSYTYGASVPYLTYTIFLTSHRLLQLYTNDFKHFK